MRKLPAIRIPYSFAAVALLLALAIGSLGWVYQLRLGEFHRYHRNFAAGTTAEIVSQVTYVLSERQRQVVLFAEDHRPLLERLVHDPENVRLHEEVGRQLRRSFPDYFAFLLTNPRGEPYWVDFDGYVGDICVEDIQTFAERGYNHARIHPNPVEYHYDVMAHWQAGTGRGRILMVSFKPDELVQKLRAVRVPGHDLYMLLADGSNLIEVTAQGPRTVLDRDDYRMTAAEAGRTVHRQIIEGTRWELADLYEPGFVAAYRHELLADIGVFLLVFLAVAAVSILLIRREEQARRRAEEAREDLMAAVTHELRTPLTSIVGSLGLLASGALGALPDRARELVDIMNRGTERLRRQIDDLLDARRIETGRLRLEPKPLDLSALVNDALAQNTGYAERLHVQFDRLDSIGPVWVAADPVRMQQIMANLLSNAAKFSPAESKVDVRLELPRPGWVRVSVSDQGPGIREEFKSQVFSRYAQDGSVRVSPVAGTGLGLSIVKTLIEMHDGRVGFDSQVGSGSMFYFELPAIAAPAPA